MVLDAMQEYSDQQNWMDKYTEVNEENKKLKSELKDCMENYNHYVDKCFKLESELKDKERVNEGLSKSKLEILNEVKFSFDIHSDFSSQCNGYKSLCKQIEHLTNLTQTMKTHQHYYLINGKIMSGNEKMPKLTMYSPFYDSEIMIWKHSLQPCEISESELEKIISELNNSRIIYPRKNELIEVTDMIRIEEIKTITKSGTITDFQFFFKHPKQVELNIEIEVLSDQIKQLSQTIETYKAKLEVLKERKKSIELYNQK